MPRPCRRAPSPLVLRLVVAVEAATREDGGHVAVEVEALFVGRLRRPRPWLVLRERDDCRQRQPGKRSQTASGTKRGTNHRLQRVSVVRNITVGHSNREPLRGTSVWLWATPHQPDG